VLQITNLTKVFGDTTALDAVNLTVQPGEMVAIIGRSGAGKSTLLRSINRLNSVTSGEINFEGRLVGDLGGRALREWRRSCAMVFQQFNLVGRMDVLSNVLIGRVSYQGQLRSCLKLFTRAERALAILALERVEMSEFALQRADTLSGGQQQRVAIARALVQEPRILLADEPIASLDPRSAMQVMELLRDINRRDGITVICNLHTLDTARSYCDRIIGMRAGRIVFDGDAAALDTETARAIYGAGSGEKDFDESLTSTALPSTLRAVGAN
jgi:phosphonate transport system ATP-binding protein